MRGRIKERLKVVLKVLTAKNYAYFQYDRAEFIECANITTFKNYYQCISPNEDDDINKFFGKVILSKISDYLKDGERV